MFPVAKAALKRGALVTAANWETILLQFVAEASFKALVAVPLAGAAILLGLVAGDGVGGLLDRGIRDTLASLVTVLGTHRGALVACLVGVAVAIGGGTLLMSIVRSGTTAVLVDAEHDAPEVERPPLRLATVRLARQFTVARYLDGVDHYGARFVGLGCASLGAYAVTIVVGLGPALAGYRALVDGGFALTATVFAAAVSGVLVVVINGLNLVQVLSQIAIVSDGSGIVRGIGAALTLLRARPRELGAVFLVVLTVALLAAAASVLATGLLGFVGFVPIVGVVALPLQLAAWLGRGVLFQALALSALTAYAHLAASPPAAIAARRSGVSLVRPGVGPRRIA